MKQKTNKEIIHFGIFSDEVTYENQLIRTLCGCTGELPLENSTDDWKSVTCKKCLRLEMYKSDYLDYLDYIDSIENEELKDEKI